MVINKEVYGGFTLHIAFSQIKSQRIWVKQASIDFIECVQIWEESRSIPSYFLLNHCSTNKVKKGMNFNTEIDIEFTKKTQAGILVFHVWWYLSASYSNLISLSLENEVKSIISLYIYDL